MALGPYQNDIQTLCELVLLRHELKLQVRQPLEIQKKRLAQYRKQEPECYYYIITVSGHLGFPCIIGVADDVSTARLSEGKNDERK